MSHDDLLKQRRIQKHKASPEEVDSALDLARRDIKTARILLDQDWDWSFAVAYNAVLQASRSYMFATGFRPASNESHKNTFAFMLQAVGDEHKDMVTYFDRMRLKRNQTIYDVAGVITETEAFSILQKAEAFVHMIAHELTRRECRPTEES
ncbi:MAG: HEPN domain-containing protein [Dehalococcoidia bacterium]